MAKDINLQSFTISDFGGISSEHPIVFYVADAYAEGKNIAIASGDEQKGKTSWLTAIMGLLGQSFDIKEENFVNTKTGKLNNNLEFEYKGSQYRVTWTKSAFKLQKKEINELTEREVWRDEMSPSATLKKIIGYVGTSPMSLKTKDGAKQVEEIRKSLSVSKDVEKEEKSLNALMAQAKQSRTEANRDFERLKKGLESNEMYLNWEENEVKYAEKKTSEEEKEKIKALEQRKNQYALATQKMERYALDITAKQRDILAIEEQIERLQAQLVLDKDELTTLQTGKTNGHKWIEDNKAIVSEYETAQEAFLNIERYLAEQTQWEDVKRKKKEMDEFSDAVVKLDGQKDELKQKILNIGKEGMPDIEGLEVITSDAIEGRERGVYLHDKNVYQLSESELWGLFLRIWESQGVKYVFVENITSLGSHAVDILNNLAGVGVKIFATKMERKGDFKITLTDKIE